MATECVLITGTTSGVGRALLEHYVAQGHRVVSVNRRRVPELESRFPLVRFEQVDVRVAEAVERLVERLVESDDVPDVFFLNAGINRVDNDDTFDLGAYQEVVDTNLYGVLNFVPPLMRLPRASAPRHVIAISSMANYVGNPYGLGYHTSKRALTSCFETWSRMYRGTDLAFQQVMLGPVQSAIYSMDQEFPAWMVRTKALFSGSLDGMVKAVSRFAQTRESKLFHPWQAVPLYVGMWLARSLVPGFFQGRKTLGGNERRKPSRDGGRAEGED